MQATPTWKVLLLKAGGGGLREGERWEEGERERDGKRESGGGKRKREREGGRVERRERRKEFFLKGDFM